MNKENRNKLIDTENVLVVAGWKGVGEVKGERLRCANYQLQKQSQGCKVKRNIVNNIVITMYGVRSG